MMGLPLRLSDTPGSVAGPTPELGQHTQPILQELGYSSADIEALREQSWVR